MAVLKTLWKTLIAMRHGHFAKTIFNKNSFFTCLLRLLLISELNVARSWLLIVVFFLHCNGGAQRPNKFTENKRHSLLLLNRRPLVVGFNSMNSVLCSFLQFLSAKTYCHKKITSYSEIFKGKSIVVLIRNVYQCLNYLCMEKLQLF